MEPIPTPSPSPSGAIMHSSQLPQWVTSAKDLTPLISEVLTFFASCLPWILLAGFIVYYRREFAALIGRIKSINKDGISFGSTTPEEQVFAQDVDLSLMQDSRGQSLADLNKNIEELLEKKQKDEADAKLKELAAIKTNAVLFEKSVISYFSTKLNGYTVTHSGGIRTPNNPVTVVDAVFENTSEMIFIEVKAFSKPLAGEARRRLRDQMERFSTLARDISIKRSKSARLMLVVKDVSELKSSDFDDIGVQVAYFNPETRELTYV